MAWRASEVESRTGSASALPLPDDKRVRLVTGDIADRDTVGRLIAPGTNAVFHLAAIVSGQAEADTELGYRVNLDGTRAVLDACRALNTAPRFIFASSLAVYGGALPPAVGDDTALWKPLPSFFTPGTPLYSEEGGDILKQANIDAAKKLLAEAGYANEPVSCIVAQDQPITKAQGDVTADLLKRMGMNVDFVATDWGTVGARRAQKTPHNQGGWEMFHTWHAGADCLSPVGYAAIRGTGDKAWWGWPSSEKVEKEVSAWFGAKSLDEEKAAVGRLNKAAMEDVIYAPTGFFLSYTAWRKNVTGIVKGPLPFFWGVSKTA